MDSLMIWMIENAVDIRLWSTHAATLYYSTYHESMTYTFVVTVHTCNEEDL